MTCVTRRLFQKMGGPPKQKDMVPVFCNRHKRRPRSTCSSADTGREGTPSFDMSQKGHIRSDLSQVGFKCNHCGDEFDRENKLERHLCPQSSYSSAAAGGRLHPDSTASPRAHTSSFGREDAAGDDGASARGVSAEDSLAGI